MMEERVSKLERKYSALKSNVEGLHAVRVDLENRVNSMNTNVGSVSTSVATVG